MDRIKELVYNFKTKNKEGFTEGEIETLLIDFPEVNRNKFNSALRGITSMIVNDETVTYHNDIEKAMICGIENRDLRDSEWD